MTDCVVMVEANSGRSRGFGFVTFVSHDALEAVLASKQIVDGKEVDCKKACPREVMNSNNGALPKAAQVGVFRTDKIFVGGLPDLTNEEFREYFEKFGTVLEATLMVDKNTNKPRGFGFITFESPSVVNEVIRRYNEHTLKGKWVEVKKATPRESFTKNSGKNMPSPVHANAINTPPYESYPPPYPERYCPDKLSGPPHHHPVSVPNAPAMGYANDRSAYADRPPSYASNDKPMYGTGADMPWANDRSAYADRSPNQYPMAAGRPPGYGFPPCVNYTYPSYGDKPVTSSAPNYNYSPEQNRHSHNPYDRPEDKPPTATTDPYGMAQYSSATVAYSSGDRGYNPMAKYPPDPRHGAPVSSYVPARNRPNLVARQEPY
ncbi:RNA-binding protein Musashi [Babesia microti strain RI]|uniref:RNA-binding protein Musashi n=1 Tax=Babesia microti (strain RI) TaxID=1133968 RepID=I7IH55_BABMR|nr:RNA-binding protein Musashi [Babesia microti strain RI]CCF75222.2 RNA-binding protein Musashi [Babesia microti strain RI]|eukprot:XP_012649630.2 RNA-binding protein Musashi [Babesia microti strain RI]